MAKGQLPTRYPYHKWADGQWHRLERGTDYTVKTSNFRIALNTWARSNRKSVYYLDSSEDGVSVLFRNGGPHCLSCDQTYKKRSSAHKYCDRCVPQGNQRASQIMSYYRMPWWKYEELKAGLFKGRCPICNVWEATAVDHDHNCCGLIKDNGPACGGCNRGLLCVGCNIMIEKAETGKLDEIPGQAWLYLKLYGKD